MEQFHCILFADRADMQYLQSHFGANEALVCFGHIDLPRPTCCFVFTFCFLCLIVPSVFIKFRRMEFEEKITPNLKRPRGTNLKESKTSRGFIWNITKDTE